MRTHRKGWAIVVMAVLAVAGLGAVSVARSAGRCGAAGDGNPSACCGTEDERAKGEKECDGHGGCDADNPECAACDAPVNVRCPIMGSELDRETLTEDLMVEHRGHAVGVCCGGCLGPWSELSDEEKDRKLAASIDLRWHGSPEDALAEARRRNVPVVAEFHAEWCGWCRRWEAETLPNRDVQLRLLDFALLKIDTDAQPQIARRYGVTGLPTTVIIDSKGNVVRRSPGFRNAEQYLELLAGTAGAAAPAPGCH